MDETTTNNVDFNDAEDYYTSNDASCTGNRKANKPQTFTIVLVKPATRTDTGATGRLPGQKAGTDEDKDTHIHTQQTMA